MKTKERLSALFFTSFNHEKKKNVGENQRSPEMKWEVSFTVFYSGNVEYNHIHLILPLFTETTLIQRFFHVEWNTLQ